MKQSAQELIFIIISLIVLCIIGFSVGFSYISKNSDTFDGMAENTKIIGIPTVNASLSSLADGSLHKIKLQIYLEVDKKASKIDKEDIQSTVSKIVSNMDYSMITQKDGFEYVKNELRNNLGIEDDVLSDIYITEIQADNAIIEDSDEFKNERQEKVFKSLFPNMK